MIYEEDRADQCASHVLLLTSDPVIKEQIKGIIVRIGGAVKVISCVVCILKSVMNNIRVFQLVISKTKFRLSFPSKENK